MKKFIILTIVALLTAGWSTTHAQEFPEEYLGLPGDNLNLYAVMKLFQESETLEGFERSLNDENTMINNLDLNGDNLVDYIMVNDYVDGNVHTIVLRAALNQHETQDVAVFTVERFIDGSVQIQLVGDEALYGKNYIIEPYYTHTNETPNPGYIAEIVDNSNATVVRTTTYEVAAWPVIRYIYLPTYVTWHSSWRWGYYPSYWSPWRTWYWHTYYGYHSHWHPDYYRHYRVWHRPRYRRYHDFYYTKIRHFSPTVNINIRVGKYKNTYSRPDLKTRGAEIYARTNSNQNVGTRRNSSERSIRTTGSESGQRTDARARSQNARGTVTPSTKETSNRQAVRSASERNSSPSQTNASQTGRSVTKQTEKSASGISRRSTTVPTRQNANVQSKETRRTVITPAPKPVTKSSEEKRTDVTRRSSTPPKNSTPPRSSVRKSTSTQKKAVQPTTRRSASPKRSAVKSTPSRSSSKQSGSAVRSNQSGSKSRSNATKQSSSRSSSSESSGRRR
jgi:hypothetical protein